MVSTPKKKQSNRRLLSQLDVFDQDIILGNSASDRQENTLVKEATGDGEFTVGNLENKLTATENMVNMKTLESYVNGRIDREMGNTVDTVGNKIENTILTAIDSIITPEIELAIKAINASSGRDAASVMASSECGEHIRISAP